MLKQIFLKKILLTHEYEKTTMQFYISILIETIRLDFLLVIATINAIIFGYALSPLPKGEKSKKLEHTKNEKKCFYCNY